ncbi:M48 family metalloprotease [Nocardiopsis alba]
MGDKERSAPLDDSAPSIGTEPPPDDEPQRRASRAGHAPRPQRPPRRGTSGLLDNAIGNGAALIATWFNIPFVVLLVALGAIFGGIGGLVSGTIAGPGVVSRFDMVFSLVLPMPVSMSDLMPNVSFPAGGMVGGLIGTFKGGLKMLEFGVLLPYSLMWSQDPLLPLGATLGQIVSGLSIASVYVLYCRVVEAGRLRVTGARRPSRREAEFLEPIIARAAARMGLDRRPRLLMDDDREPNAYAGIHHIIVNRGLLEALRYDTEAISGVIAHEVAHYKHGDALGLAWNRGIAWPLYLLYELAHRWQASAVYWTVLLALVRVLLWSVIFTIRFLIMPLNSRHWRRSELRADAEAREAGYGPGLYTALTILGKNFDGARNGWDQSILATHPATELRLELLEEPGRTPTLEGGSTDVDHGPPASRILKD